MAEYRTIQTKIWEDEWFTSLDAEGKIFFIYLVTNYRASVAGIYTLPLRCIPFETGISQDRILTLLSEFETAGKAMYSGGVMWVTNLRRYQETSSETIQKCIEKDIKSVTDGKVKTAYKIAYQYPTNTPSIPIATIRYDTIPSDTITSTKRVRSEAIEESAPAAAFSSSDGEPEKDSPILRPLAKAYIHAIWPGGPPAKGIDKLFQKSNVAALEIEAHPRYAELGDKVGLLVAFWADLRLAEYRKSNDDRMPPLSYINKAIIEQLDAGWPNA